MEEPAQGEEADEGDGDDLGNVYGGLGGGSISHLGCVGRFVTMASRGGFLWGSLNRCYAAEVVGSWLLRAKMILLWFACQAAEGMGEFRCG